MDVGHQESDNVPDSAGVTRRGFLNTLLWVGGAALVGSVVYPITRYLVPPEQAEPNPATVNVGKVDTFQPNTGTIFKMGSQPALLVRTKDGDFRAFSAICTHLSCTVQYRADLGQIWCACHNGKYNLSGINEAGPPPRPLTPYKVNVQNGEVFVSREDV